MPATTLPNVIRQAIAAYNTRAWAEAERLCQYVLQAEPDNFDALNLLGVIAAQTQRLEQAADLLDRAVAISPHNASVLNNLGSLLLDLGRFGDALARLDQSISIRPAYPEAHYNRGVALYRLKQFEAALQAYERAIAIRPGYADAWHNRGIVLHDLKQLGAAVTSYERAIAIRPHYANTHVSLGDALKRLNRLEDAIASYNGAIAIKPDCAEAWLNRGITLHELKRLDEALASYDQALAIDPDLEHLSGFMLHTRMQICDWDQFDTQLAGLARKVDSGKNAVAPLHLLPLLDSPAIHKKNSEIHVKARYPGNDVLGAFSKEVPQHKIRIGYFSADFGEHPVAFLSAELFELHDKQQFEITAFSFGAHQGTAMQQRLAAAFDRFIDVSNKSDIETARLARELNIDIAVDLSGYTTGGRPGIFACRAAPIQVSYIGFLGTTGADHMDYLFADATIIPEESRHHYSEKIAYLPSYQVNDSQRRIADKVLARTELGLPDTGFVFCCFNNNYKITPTVFDGWMRILQTVTGSVLFLYTDNEQAGPNLRAAAQARGVDGNRLVFGQRLPRAEYLARYRAADLFLDTSPYNAGVTASDALWAGLPVLTLMGESFASRVAASLLNAIQLPELITCSQAQYEALAIELATHPQQLARIRNKLADNRLTTPLFDTPAFARHIEAAYRLMVDRHRTDLPPDHIHVA